MQNFAAPFEPDSLPAVSCSVVEDLQGLLHHGHETLLVTVFQEQVSAAEGAAAHLHHPGLTDVLQHGLSRGAVIAAMQLNGFKGKQGEVMPPVMVQSSDGGVRGLLLLGLGSKEKASLAEPHWGHNPFHAAGAALASAAKTYHLSHVNVLFQSVGDDTPAAAASFVAAALNGLYEGTVRYRSKPESKVKLQAIKLLLHGESGSSGSAGLAAAVGKGVALARAALTTRFLVEAPANVCTPSHLAEAAAHIAVLEPQHFSLQVLEEADCRELGMGLFVGVAQGSDEPLKLIHLAYKPQGPVTQKVALVGKGLTFDSGGYNLKVQGGIETMKCDMGGAGAVLGAARALAELKPQGVEVHFITAACENMVSGSATHPSDIHVSAAGITVEVNDTDAEGRLTLADALWYAQHKAGATTVIDIATLTGAAGVALGQDTGALFACSDDLAQTLDKASRRAGEKLWRMPLTESLKKKLESPIADLKNYAGRWGGAITAALFLKEFVADGVQWGHLDVAGPAWDDAASLPTGFGAATLVEWVMGASMQQQPALGSAQQ